MCISKMQIKSQKLSTYIDKLQRDCILVLFAYILIDVPGFGIRPTHMFYTTISHDTLHSCRGFRTVERSTATGSRSKVTLACE